MSEAASKLGSLSQPIEPARDRNKDKSSALISPGIDRWVVGGASILLLLVMSVALRRRGPDEAIFMFVFNLSFAVNFPHFLVSYQLLYSDFGHKIFREARYFWAAVVVPLLLLGVLGAGLMAESPMLWGHLANAMYFFVGWHYIKQIYGGITVANALEKFHYNGLERLALKTNLIALWAVAYIRANLGDESQERSGILYHSPDLPEWTHTVAYGALVVSGVSVLYVNLAKYVREGRVPSGTAIICFLSIYAWYLPLFRHPMFKHTIPLFHSVQYLLFVYAFRRNKVDAHIEHPQTPEGRKKRLLGLYGYLLVPVITGAFLMYFLPQFLDEASGPHRGVFGATPFYFAFLVFINIHHYFIDSVIWRGSNEEMRAYLFSPRSS